MNRENENIELDLLLEAIFRKYGYDFRKYSRAHIKRRLRHRLELSEIPTLSEMQRRILEEESFFDLILQDLSINVTEMFRDPSFYRAFRREVVPLLRTYPFIKVWHAGCATGEEVYSMAIVLHEEQLLKNTQIYATDFNQIVLQKAKEGIYPVERIREYTQNYQRAGGKGSFADYYTAKYDSVIIDNSLKEKVIFADHNLVTDSVFGEMNVIVCRNVLIYFEKPLQNRVIKLFLDSMKRGAFLCLGSKESIRFTKYVDSFEEVVPDEKIYRKRYPK